MPGAWEFGTPQVLVATLTRELVAMKWAMNYRRLQLPPNSTESVLSGMPFDHARNTACENMLAHGFQWIFMMDDDVCVPGDVIHRLMAHQKDIVSGIYYRRAQPVAPVMLRHNNKGEAQWVTSWPDDQKLIEVDLVGAGCLLIHRRVLERMARPWFEWELGKPAVPGEPPKLSEDFRFCFPEGFWIYGDNCTRIEDASKSNRVLTHEGIDRKIIDTIKRHYNGMLAVIEPIYGEKIKATPSHRFLTVHQEKTWVEPDWNKANTQWMAAEDITTKEWLCLPKPRLQTPAIDKLSIVDELTGISETMSVKNGTIGYSRTRKAALRLPLEIEITPDLCRLIGYAVAELSYLSNYTGLAFNFGAEPEYIKDCLDLLLKAFNAVGSAYKKKNQTSVVCSSKPLALLFSQLCGRYEHNKHLPLWWRSLSPECLRQLVRGYWFGDGYYSDKHGFSMVTVSERLAHEIHFALLHLGILASIKSAKNTNNYKKKTTQKTHRSLKKYIIQIPFSLTRSFGELVGYPCDNFIGKDRSASFRENEKYFFVRVRKKSSETFAGDVYNLTVEDIESYTVNGIAVHNCREAKRSGFKVYVDTTIKCEHIGLGESRHEQGGSFTPSSVG